MCDNKYIICYIILTFNNDYSIAIYCFLKFDMMRFNKKYIHIEYK